jgi:hypothetical protein
LEGSKNTELNLETVPAGLVLVLVLFGDDKKESRIYGLNDICLEKIEM